MRETYLTFALWTSVIAIGMWGVALFFRSSACESSPASKLRERNR